MIKNIFLFLGMLVILSIGGEWIVRYALREVTTTADNSSYFARRWKEHHVKLNTWGYRDRDFSIQKPDGVYRIAVVGDSLTYGQGIAEQERFSNLIETKLNEGSGGYQVLNFGRPGTETVDHLAAINTLVLKSKPDFILLQWYINDFEGEVTTPRPAPHPLIPHWGIHSLLHSSSALYYLLNQQWSALQTHLGFVASYQDYLLHLLGDPSTAESRQAIKTLDELIDTSLRHDIPIAIVLFPDTGYQEGRPYPYGYLHERVLESCKKKQIPCLDIMAVLAPYYDLQEFRKLRASRLDGHPSAMVNQLAADRILEEFEPIWRTREARNKTVPPTARHLVDMRR
jgi:lysophospholipase L1-like esterase